MSDDRDVTLRRQLQQAKHCIEEALSVVERKEDVRCALDDVDQALGLLHDTVRPALVDAVGDRRRGGR